jgi:hypothetical protein
VVVVMVVVVMVVVIILVALVVAEIALMVLWFDVVLVSPDNLSVQ